jgi:ACS family pantothenate transporter-like MFS transporter
MNAFAYIFTAWIPIFTFPTNLQPYIVTGNYVTAGFAACALILALTIGYLHNRDGNRAEAALEKRPGSEAEVGI